MPSIIETANALSIPSFRTNFLPSLSSTYAFHVSSPAAPTLPPHRYTISLDSGPNLSARDFLFCYELVRSTSSAAYQASSIGWLPGKKRNEMRLADMRYLLVKSTAEDIAGGEEVEGFLSFMLTYEDGFEVIYCYEIHLKPLLRGSGLGKQLIGLMEEVGQKVGVAKAMLTVFVENEGALRFYEKLGYEEDEFSPGPRKLRNGVVKNPTYIILSKILT
ncbi:hypothetical protein MMC07_002362 [Pseudocyphellaria aurata]|nr:hypothetical protein [Pseudocyphellaria aurata]